MLSKQYRNLHAMPADAEALESLIHMTVWARQAAMREAAPQPPSGPVVAIRSVGAIVKRAWHSHRHHSETARAAALLSAMDDHALQDIGISRVDIRHAVRFGRDWDRWH